MNRASAIAAALALACLGVAAQAVTVDTVSVGNPGNVGDYRFGEPPPGPYPASFGSVSYAYRVGKYEVTSAQYTEFLNAVAKTDPLGLYNSNMWSDQYGCKIEQSGSSGSYIYSVASDWANRPVNYVSFWDACRFANWLQNGQPTGPESYLTTERGAYYLGGYNGNDGRNIQRGAGWQWAVTTEDEWYKAAYYDPNKPGGAGYWNFPTRSDTGPANQVLSTDPGNSSNYYANGFSIGSPYYRTNVGEFENSGSPYGTFDQAGNVHEWNEALTYTITGGANGFRGLRGGSYDEDGGPAYAGYRSTGYYPNFEDSYIGFRVSQAVPEPSSIIALFGGLVSLLGLARRRA